MKEFLLAVCMLMAGVFVWFLCRSWDNFLDKYRKAQKKHREDNLPGRDE